MKQLLSFIVDSITGQKVKIKEEKKEGSVVFTVSLPKEKIGLLIGKKGKTIKAINLLLAIKKNREKAPSSFSVNFKEQD